MSEKNCYKKAIIVGATSGIGRALAVELDNYGYQLAICGRREELLTSLSHELSLKPIIQPMDVSNYQQSIEQLKQLIEKLGDVELIVLNSGTAHMNKKLPWEEDKKVINVNVSGFTALAGASYQYFYKRKAGHLVGISSIGGLRGGPATAYNASKAYMSIYMDGMRFNIAKKKLPITVSDIRPGFVDTDLSRGGVFWVATPKQAAKSIYKAILKKKKVAYITPRWRLIAGLLHILPDKLYHKI